jgi:hypothetical protein
MLNQVSDLVEEVRKTGAHAFQPLAAIVHIYVTPPCVVSTTSEVCEISSVRGPGIMRHAAKKAPSGIRSHGPAYLNGLELLSP